MVTSAKPLVHFAEFGINPEKKKEVADLIRPVGEFEHKQDQCGAYCLSVPLDGGGGGDTPCLVFETYDDGNYLENTHMKSETFTSMGQKAATLDLGMKPGALAKYTTKGGFLSREKAASEPLKDQFIWIARFKANPGKRDEFMQAVLTHTANVQRTEDGTLSFVALESPEDDVSIALFERYTSKKYFDEVHFTSGSMKEFREKIGPLMAERKSAGYQAAAGFIDKKEALA